MTNRLRVALRIVPVLAVVFVAALSLFCTTSDGEILIIEPTTPSISSENGYTTISMDLDVTVMTPSPLEDVMIDVTLTDPSGKSRVNLWNGGPFTFEPGIKETIHMDSRIRTLPCILLLYDNLGSPGSPMRFEVDARFDYAFSMIGAEVSTSITVSPSPDNESLSASAEDRTDTVTVEVSGLRQAYIPGETNFDIEDGSDAVNVEIVPSSDGFLIKMSSDRDVTDILSSMNGATIVMGNGDTVPLDPSTIETILDLLSSLGVEI